MDTLAVQLIKELYEAFGRRDMATVFRLLSEEIEIVQSTELPWGGSYRGHAGAQEFFGKLTQRIDSTVTIERTIGAGDHVIVTGWTRGKVNGTGAGYDVPFAHVWQVRDGRAVRGEFYIDHPAMLAALAQR